MQTTMQTTVMIGSRKHEIREVAIPKVGDDEVLIKVTACGVCSSELYVWKTGMVDRRTDEIIFGHEPVGVIVEIGGLVKGFKTGDRVTGLFERAFADYTTAQYENLVKVPDELSDIEALGEPLSCLMSGALRTPVDLGDTAAIIGTGFMGLGFMQLFQLGSSTPRFWRLPAEGCI